MLTEHVIFWVPPKAIPNKHWEGSFCVEYFRVGTSQAKKVFFHLQKDCCVTNPWQLIPRRSSFLQFAIFPLFNFAKPCSWCHQSLTSHTSEQFIWFFFLQFAIYFLFFLFCNKGVVTNVSPPIHQSSRCRCHRCNCPHRELAPPFSHLRTNAN